MKLLHPGCLEFRFTKENIGIGPQYTAVHLRGLMQCFAHLCASGLDEACIKIACPDNSWLSQADAVCGRYELAIKEFVALGCDLAKETCKCGDHYNDRWAGKLDVGERRPQHQCSDHVEEAHDRLVFCKTEIRPHKYEYIHDTEPGRFISQRGLTCYSGCCLFEGDEEAWVESALYPCE